MTIGFFATNFKINKCNEFTKEINEGSVYLCDLFNCKQYIAGRNTTEKFLGDKPFYEDDEIFLVMEGVLLNSVELQTLDGVKTVADLCKSRYKKSGDAFFTAFRGPFSGALFDKKEDKWIVFTSQIGDGPVFYYQNQENFILSSSVTWIKNLLMTSQNQGIPPYTLNKDAVYYGLTYGYMGDDSTYISEIKRLQAGCFLTIKNNVVLVKRYHQFANMEKLEGKALTEDKIIEEIDERFRRAVRLEYEKDKEYGYKHIAFLSGGFDSRMNIAVAHDMGYTDILALTFSQNNYLDEKIAKEIAAGYEIPWVFKSLDDATFTKDIDKIIEGNFGLTDVPGWMHENSLVQYIDYQSFGLQHTGQVGDVILATKCEDKRDKPQRIAGQNSSILVNKLDQEHIHQYENEEMYLLYNRQFRGTIGSHFVEAERAYYISPFLDVDFLEYCLSISTKIRRDHNIYKKWIVEKYPKAARFKWEKTNALASDGKMVTFLKRLKHYGIKRPTRYLLRKFGVNLKIKPYANSMNPFDYWYTTKPWMRQYMDDYFKENIQNQQLDDEMKSDISLMYQKGTAREKLQALSVLGAIKLYFSEGNTHERG